MNKNFLVTISNDTNNLSGVQFICNFFKGDSGHHLTLLHICRQDSPQAMSSTLGKMWDRPDEANIEGQLTLGAKKAIDKSRQMLAKSKVSIDKMVVKTVAERYGKVYDIITEGSKGLYDAVVLGKRASYALQWLVERPADEIAQSILKGNALYIPLWVCPEVSSEKKNVLVCLDGSDSSYRAVDHVAYMLAHQEQHNITLFYVKTAEGSDYDSYVAKANKILREHGVAESRVRVSSSWGLSVAGTILGKAKSEKYAAIALGLCGNDHGLLKDFNLAGGTTSTIISKVENCSVWCCP